LFLGAFAKLPKATICFVMSARPYVRMEQLGTQWSFFITFDIGKSVDKIQVLLKSDKNNGIFK